MKNKMVQNLYKMEAKDILAIIVVMLIAGITLGIATAADEQEIITCGGDNELIIGCSPGDLENSPIGLQIDDVGGGQIEKEQQFWKWLFISSIIIFIIVMSLIILFIFFIKKRRRKNEK